MIRSASRSANRAGPSLQSHRYPGDQAVAHIRFIDPKRQNPNTAWYRPALIRMTGARCCRHGNSGPVINGEDNSIAYAIALEKSRRPNLS